MQMVNKQYDWLKTGWQVEMHNLPYAMFATKPVKKLCWVAFFNQTLRARLTFFWSIRRKNRKVRSVSDVMAG
jgi:hypothetical protein